MPDTAAHPTARLTGIIPQFLVTDLERAIAYYCDQLGFTLDFVYQDFYASVVRDGFAIHLKHGKRSSAEQKWRAKQERLDAYVSVVGARDLFREIEARRALVVSPLQEQPWACLEFYVEDPDGHVLCFSERIP